MTRVRVAFFAWERRFDLGDARSPTGAQLAAAVARHGQEVVPVNFGDFGHAWLAGEGRGFDVIHLNWLQPFYDDARPARTRAGWFAQRRLGGSRLGRYVAGRLRLAQFERGLRAAKRAGKRIVWTLHNVLPHESRDMRLDMRCRRVVAEAADAVVVPCRRGAVLLREHFGRSHDVFVVPRGHLLDVYPNVVSRAQARQMLGLASEAYVYLFFGLIRPYKGVEGLLEAFASRPDPRLRLVIAGNPASRELERDLAARAGSDARVLFHPGAVAVDRVQIYMNAANAVVLPFIEVLNSASAIAALGFARPVVAPALGCLPELFDGQPCGVLYDPGAAGALAGALDTVRALDPQAAGAAALARARAHDWDSIAKQMLAIYAPPDANS